MTKDFSKFAGWLSFFQIIHWIWFILILAAYIFYVSLTLLVALINLSFGDVLYIFPVSLLFFCRFFFLTRIFIIIEKKSEAVPAKIVRYWLFQFIMEVLVLSGLYLGGYLARYLRAADSLTLFVSGLSLTLCWYIIWVIYFRYSRRVREYYGVNSSKLF